MFRCHSDVQPETTWKLASDLRRFDEWMTIFGGWRGPVPSTIEKGTCPSTCIKVKGFRSVVHWEVIRFDEPKSIELQGLRTWWDSDSGGDDRDRQGFRIGFSPHRRPEGRSAQRADRRAGRQSPPVRRA